MTEWGVVSAGPADASRGVLLLPGGFMSARSYRPLMAEAALAGVRLVAATLPGNAGQPIEGDVSIEAQARQAAHLARVNRCDVAAGFSIGASVALQMVLAGEFAGPVVLAGISLTAADEAGFFLALVRATRYLGALPMVLLKAGVQVMARHVKADDPHRRELRQDAARNRAADMVQVCREYVRYLEQSTEPAAALVATGVPAWVVHAEKGDGGLTAVERDVLARSPNVTLVTVPGSVFLLTSEAPGALAAAVAAAVGAQPAGPSRDG